MKDLKPESKTITKVDINKDSSFCLIDYKHPQHGWANRDMTGGYGSGPNDNNNLFFKIFKEIKKSFIRIPSTVLATSKSILLYKGFKVSTSNDYIPGYSHYVIHSSIHHYKYELDLAKKIRSNENSAKIIFIGPFSESKPELFKNYSDIIVFGEFESWCENLPLNNLKKSYDSFKKFSEFPLPSWDKQEIKSSSYFPALPKRPFLTLQGSRGCPFACEFCPYIVSQGIPMRAKDNKTIIQELKYLKNKYNAKSILFRDITWSYNVKKTKDLCDLIISLKKEENIFFDIGVETRLDKLDIDLIKKMAAAGVKSINVGLESPVSKILNEAGRITFDLTEAETKVKLMEKLGIKVQAFYILGLPDDTVESMKSTIDFAIHMNTFTAQFCVFTPFPGTPTYEKYKDSIITDDFMQFNEYTPVVSIKGATTEEIKLMTAKAYKNYYFRFGYFRKYFLAILKSFYDYLYHRAV